MSAVIEPVVVTSAILAGEIARKRARKDALQFRQGEISAELATLRTAQARALADGADNTSRASLSAFVQEQEALTRAVAMLDADVAALEREHANAVQLETQDAEAIATTHATAALEQLEATVRNVATERVLPDADALTAALRQLRHAAQTASAARQNAGQSAGTFARIDPAERLTKGHGALLQLMASLRTYVEN